MYSVFRTSLTSVAKSYFVCKLSHYKLIPEYLSKSFCNGKIPKIQLVVHHFLVIMLVVFDVQERRHTDIIYLRRECEFSERYLPDF